MGFGLLLLGYLISYFFGVVFSYPCYLIGFLLMFVAAGKLQMFKRSFVYALVALIPGILIALYMTVGRLLPSGVLPMPEGGAGTVSAAVFQTLCFLVWEFFLFSSAQLSASVGLLKLRNRCVQNMVVVGFYYVLMLLQEIRVFNGIPFFSQVMLILYFVVVLFSLLQFGSCYRQICPEGDEQMPRKPSRFAFVNQFYEKLDQKEKKAVDEVLKEHRKSKEKKK